MNENEAIDLKIKLYEFYEFALRANMMGREPYRVNLSKSYDAFIKYIDSMIVVSKE